MKEMFEPDVITIDSDEEESSLGGHHGRHPAGYLAQQSARPLQGHPSKGNLSYAHQVEKLFDPPPYSLNKGQRIPAGPGSAGAANGPVQHRQMNPLAAIRNMLPAQTSVAETKAKSSAPVANAQGAPRFKQNAQHVSSKVHSALTSAIKGQHFGSAFMGKGHPAPLGAESTPRPNSGSAQAAASPVSKAVLGARQKYPNRPSKFSSFLLFSQEHREKLLRDNRDLSFCEVGRALGKLWRELSVDDKNKYRVQARQLQEQKYVAWEKELMKLSGPAQLQYLASTTKQHKRRRKSGYDVFMLEMRKNLTSGLSQPEIMKKIGEAWRCTPDETRNDYERRADALNREAETHNSFDEKRKEDGATHRILKLIRDSKEAIRHSTPEGTNSTIHRTSSNMGNGSLVGGISYNHLPAPPPLVLGGKAVPKASETYNGNEGPRALKRNYPPEIASSPLGSPAKRATTSFQEDPEKGQAQAPLCRLCGQRSLTFTDLVTKPDIIQTIKIVLTIDIDIRKDELAGYPSTVCLKCLGLLTSLESFRSSVTAGQDKLKFLTVSTTKTNGVSVTPQIAKVGRNSVSVKKESTPVVRTHQPSRILSNKPMPRRVSVKEEFSEDVENLEDELLRLEELQKENASKESMEEDTLAHYFDDSTADELKKIAGISDDDDFSVEEVVDDIDFGGEHKVGRNLSGFESSSEAENLEDALAADEMNLFQNGHKEDSTAKPSNKSKLGEETFGAETYKYFQLKKNDDLLDCEDENEVEEIDCRDIDI